MKILEANDIVAGYGKSEILHGVSMHLEAKEVVTIIGPNGAGKSTLLKALMGYVSIFKGEIRWKGDDVTRLKPHEKVTRGFGYVPQLGNVFPSLSILENLEMGGFTQPKRIFSCFRCSNKNWTKRQGPSAAVSDRCLGWPGH
jgi:ABC-type branched-subunit amino acid transport system ATPase component